MAEGSAEAAGWFDWLAGEPSFVPERSEDLLLTSLRLLELNGRSLYLKATPDLQAISPGEWGILQALARQGDTVFIAISKAPGQVQLSYRMPDLENAVAFDRDGLLGVIGQWFVWASTAAA